MHYEEIRRRLRTQPFQPFRIRLSNGTTYDVMHPDLVMIGRMAIDIGIPAPDLPSDVYDRAVTVSMLHVAEIMPLPGQQPAPSANNGPA
jgi:hypothetical protein